MKLLDFVKLEQNESVLEAEERKKNRERREYLKDLQAEGETLWVYPFVDSPHSNGIIKKVRCNRDGHLIGTISTEAGKFDIVLDKIQIHHFSDGDFYPFEEAGSTASEKVDSPFKAFSKAWDEYINEFNT